MLIFLSDVLYWKDINHPIIEKLYHNLNAFDDYPVENFHSLIRRNITTKITAPDTLRRYGITIDYEKNDNQFIGTLISEKSYLSTKPILEHLSKKSAILNFRCRNERGALIHFLMHSDEYINNCIFACRNFICFDKNYQNENITTSNHCLRCPFCPGADLGLSSLSGFGCGVECNLYSFRTLFMYRRFSLLLYYP